MSALRRLAHSIWTRQSLSKLWLVHTEMRLRTRPVGGRGWRASAHVTRAMDRAPASDLRPFAGIVTAILTGLVFWGVLVGVLVWAAP